MSTTPEQRAELRQRAELLLIGQGDYPRSPTRRIAESILALLDERDTREPAWTSGPPTEPGEWWVTLASATVAPCVAVEISGGRVGLRWGDGRFAGVINPDRVLAHMPLSRPEPYRGEP